MRIAYDHQIFSAQSYGGISRYYVRLAEKLIDEGQDVAVFAPLHRNKYLGSLPISVVHGYELRHLFPRSDRAMMLLNQLIAMHAIKKWHPALVHETYYSRARIAPRGCPTVVTVYDMIHEKFADYFSPNSKASELKRAAVERADHVICISASTRKDLVELFNINEDKVSVVHLGYERFGNNPQGSASVTHENKPYLLYVGNRGGYKNFSGLLKAISKSARLRDAVDVVTFGGGDFNDFEQQEIAGLGFNPGQIRHVAGGDEILGDLYTHAAAFVYPSLYEGFGLPPLEAMAHNCPVISSNTSSMPEVIGDAGEFFDPASITDMAAAIERVVYSPSRASELVKRGQQRLTHFSWVSCAESTLEIYRKVVGAL